MSDQNLTDKIFLNQDKIKNILGISELEKTQITKVFYEQWVDKLTELKEQLRLEVDMRITNTKTLNKFLNDWANRVKNNREVLRELKESVKVLGGFSNEHAKSIVENFDNIINVQEILLELGNKLIGWQKEKQNDYDKKCFAKSLQYTLAKLDNPTLGDGIPADARFPATDKTEKKDIEVKCPKCYCKFKYIKYIIKDSEKEVNCIECGKKYTGKIPLIPNIDWVCEKCYKDSGGVKDDFSWQEIDKKLLERHRKSNREPRENELQEWRETDKVVLKRLKKRGFLVVKREDLLKMIKELRYKIYGYDKEEWFTPIEKQLGYDYMEDLKKIKKEREGIRD